MSVIGAGALLAPAAPARRGSGGEQGQGGADFLDSLQGAVDASRSDANAVTTATEPETAADADASPSPDNSSGADIPASPEAQDTPVPLALMPWAFPSLNQTAPVATPVATVPANLETTPVVDLPDVAPLTGTAEPAATEPQAGNTGAGGPSAAIPAAAPALAAAATGAMPPAAGKPAGEPAPATATTPAMDTTAPTTETEQSAAVSNGPLPKNSGTNAGVQPSQAAPPSVVTTVVADTASQGAQTGDGEPATAVRAASSEPGSGDAVVLPKTPEVGAAQLVTVPNPAAAVASPAVLTAPVAAAPAAPVGNQPGHPPLAEQLSRPIFALATGQSGSQVMTVQVVPDSLGPVTVRAHMGADGVRIELLAATDAGRDGLRLIMTDLKRDLAGQGISSSLSLNPDLGSGAGGSGQAFRGNTSTPTSSWQQGPTNEGSGTEPPAQAPAARTTSTISLDITV
ncbi:flagellar hook-length control protein FliK [Arthrobacter sp. GMC3]|uniref:flagellar hook-length control protein FliK n=1 Tax=Arthrobacter sp. GMC3 TaxID=2058894 RepID=UPI000CE3210F|nr:flagellar hook-length control protein FliK [Arthrobacter sp. GMC3]